jgi:prevent-host-death family protein
MDLAAKDITGVTIHLVVRGAEVLQCGHMDRIGVRELKQTASAVLRRVAGGEALEVTDRGRPVARIVPIVTSALEQLILEGRATPAEGDLLKAMDELGLPIPADEGLMPLSQALAELRADERY